MKVVYWKVYCYWQPNFHLRINKVSLSPFTGSSAMNKLRQSFRRKKDVYVPESSRPHQWQTDEEAVRSGKCSFAVKVTFSHTHTWIQNLTNAFHRHTISLRMQCWPLSHTHTSEKPALQGRCLWLIISIQRLWGQLLSRLQDYELEPSKICGMCVHNWFLATKNFEKHLNHQVYKE